MKNVTACAFMKEEDAQDALVTTESKETVDEVLKKSLDNISNKVTPQFAVDPGHGVDVHNTTVPITGS